MINRIFPPMENRISGWLSRNESDLVPGCVDVSEDRTAIHRLDSGNRVFIPEYYEPRYAYPLFVWLSGGSRPSRDFETDMCGVSSRNCLGLQLRLDAAADNATDNVLALIRQEVIRLRQDWHVHTERIFVVGVDRTSRSALSAFLARPEWFGGAVTLGGTLMERPAIPFRNPQLRGKRLFLASTSQGTAAATADTGRTLHAAGLDVASRHYDALGEDSPTIGRDLNDWLMQGLCVTV